MQDPDRWRDLGVHWHAYVTTDADSDRQARLDQPPDRVLTSPDEVADWVAGLVRTHVHQRPVRLPADKAWARLGDVEHVERDQDGDHLVASRGDSLYVDIPRQDGRLYLHAEAVTPNECPDGHRQEDTS